MKTYSNEQAKRQGVDRQNIQITKKYLFICIHICLYIVIQPTFTYIGLHIQVQVHDRSKIHIFITDIY